MSNKISMYQSAWITLKRKKSVDILVTGKVHADRVAKAVRKRKDLDIQFKEHRLETKRRYRIQVNLDPRNKLLTLKLICLNGIETI